MSMHCCHLKMRNRNSVHETAHVITVLLIIAGDGDTDQRGWYGDDCCRVQWGREQN